MRQRWNHHRRRSGFTLVELVLSLAITVLLTGVIASAILLAGKALPSDSSAETQVREASDFLTRFAELSSIAQSVTTATADTLEFQVADITGDDAADTVRFTVSGKTITRYVNGAVDGTLLTESGGFTYKWREVDGEPEEREVRTVGSEELLFSFDGWTSILSILTVTNEIATVRGGLMVAARVPIAARENAVGLYIDRVLLKAKERSTFTPSLQAQVRDTSGTVPASTPRMTSAVLTTLPGTMSWVELRFSGDPIDPVPNKVWIVAAGGKDEAADVRYQERSTSGDQAAVFTIDSGASWFPSDSNRYGVPIYVYGRYIVTTTETVTPVRTFLQLVRLSCVVHGTELETSAAVLNQPEV